MEQLNLKIIGLGGIGSILCDKVARFLNHKNDITSKITLVDGDTYEMKNLERQSFFRLGNKASVQFEDLIERFSKIEFEEIPHYVDAESVASIIKDGDVILLCVDNHKTRKIVSDYTQKLGNVILISGGNDLLDGNVQIHIRKEGKNLTPTLVDYHPEIDNPEDRLPTEMSCEELSQSEPQLFFVNLGVATIMCWALYNTIIKGDCNISEVYFDMPSMKTDSKVRAVPTTSADVQ